MIRPSLSRRILIILWVKRGLKSIGTPLPDFVAALLQFRCQQTNAFLARILYPSDFFETDLMPFFDDLESKALEYSCLLRFVIVENIQIKNKLGSHNKIRMDR